MGRLSGALRCIKYLLLTFNLIFLLAGAAIIATGLWIRFGVTPSEISEELSKEYKEIYGSFFIGLYVLIAAGVLMMIIGFFGCCGAARESQCLLGAFFACLLVIFAIEIASGVFVFLGKDQTIEEMKNAYNRAYEQKNNRTLAVYHTAMKCCGKETHESFKIVEDLCPEDQREHKDCLEEIRKTLHRDFQITGIVAIVTAGITVFGMIFSMVLCCAIRNSRDML
ncbi:tetraspanin-2 [Discoglossus pictus]